MSPPWGYGPILWGVRLPSLGRRLFVAGVILVPLLLLTIGVPTYLLGLVGSRGGSSPLSGLQLTAGGLAVSGLVASAYVLRPTRAYGPLVAVRGAVTAAYFVSLSTVATVIIPLGGGAAAAANFGALLRWFALVPLFALVGGVLFAASDARDLHARLRVEYPA